MITTLVDIFRLTIMIDLLITIMMVIKWCVGTTEGRMTLIKKIFLYIWIGSAILSVLGLLFCLIYILIGRLFF